MLKKLLCCCLLIIFIFPSSAEASLTEDVNQFKQRYSSIYDAIDPAIAAKMEPYLQDVVNYVVINYDAEIDINIQIKNAVASVLLTGDTYKYDLLPFLVEQSKNKEIYQAQLTEMKAIVLKEVKVRLNQPSGIEYFIEKVVIIKDEQLLEMDLNYFTDARMAGMFVFDDEDKLIIPFYIKSSNGYYYSITEFTNARMASINGLVTEGLSLLNQYPEFIKNIQPGTINNSLFIQCRLK